jgi:hypothetical protein
MHLKCVDTKKSQPVTALSKSKEDRILLTQFQKIIRKQRCEIVKWAEPVFVCRLTCRFVPFEP